jgi:multiple sugar transport system substrate-binding protein
MNRLNSTARGIPRRFASALLALLLIAPGIALAQQNAPITILINDSPWLAGFEALVERYEQETGNQVGLNVTPFPGMLQKSRNAVTADESEFDLINLNEQWYSLFYDNELVAPIHEIDPDFQLDPEVIEYANATRWNHEIGYSTEDGILYGLPINGNIQLFFYRKDLFEEHGLEVPQTWDEVEAAAKVLHNPPRMVGLANRTSPGNWEFQSYLNGYGGGILELDEETGQWEVVVNEEPSIRALEQWIHMSKTYGPANYANLGQAEVLSLMQSGRAAMAHMVGAAAPNLEDPQQSVVADKVGATVVPGPTPEQRATMSGIWVMGIPQNIPEERKQAALDFMEWALSKDAQMHYARSGAIPVRQDVYEELGQEEEFSWMQAMAASTPYIHPQPRVAEAPQIIEVLTNNVNAALLEEVTPEQAMQRAAEEIQRIMEQGGYDVVPLD